MKQILLLLFTFISFTSLLSQSQRMVFLEEFTQASCPPCEATTPALNALVDANVDKIVQIRYQTSWPGVDPMNADNPGEVQERVDYYDVTGVPTFLIDGVESAGNAVPAQATVDASYDSDAPILIKVSHQMSDNLTTADVNVTITNEGTTDYVPGDAKLRVALTEEAISWDTPPGSTSIQVFEAVLKTFFTGAAGMELPTIAAGETWENTWSDLAIPFTIYNANTLGVVAFVQDDSDRSVDNAAYSHPQALPNGTDYPAAGVLTSSSVSSDLCDLAYNPSMGVLNEGTMPISGYSVTFWVNGEAIETIAATDDLDAGGLQSFDFAPYTLQAGTSEINYTVVLDQGEINTNNNITESIFAAKISDEVSETVRRDFESDGAGTIPEGIIPATPLPTFVVSSAGTTTGPLGAFGQSDASVRVNFYQWNPANINPNGSMVIAEKVMVDSDFANLTFDYAFTTWGGSNDGLGVEVSTDCGNTYTSLWSAFGADLRTAPELNNDMQAFVPAANQWARIEVSLADYIGEEILIRYAFTSAWGDMMYIDDINMVGVSNLDELTSNEELSIFPNPTTDLLNVDMTIEGTESVSFKLVNMLGQTVAQRNLGTKVSGRINETISTNDLDNGSYLLHFSIGERQVVRRVSVVH